MGTSAPLPGAAASGASVGCYSLGVVITIVEVTGTNSSELRIRHNLGGQPYRLVGYMRVAEEQALAGFRSGGGRATNG